jgi:hypothetical protein
MRTGVVIQLELVLRTVHIPLQYLIDSEVMLPWVRRFHLFVRAVKIARTAELTVKLVERTVKPRVRTAIK